MTCLSSWAPSMERSLSKSQPKKDSSGLPLLAFLLRFPRAISTSLLISRTWSRGEWSFTSESILVKAKWDWPPKIWAGWSTAKPVEHPTSRILGKGQIIKKTQRTWLNAMRPKGANTRRDIPLSFNWLALLKSQNRLHGLYWSSKTCDEETLNALHFTSSELKTGSSFFSKKELVEVFESKKAEIRFPNFFSLRNFASLLEIGFDETQADKLKWLFP